MPTDQTSSQAESNHIFQRATQSDWAGSLGRWLIFASGTVLIVAVLILPAQIDLRETRIQRDLALHQEQAQHDRIARFESFLAELQSPSQETIELLALSQLGKIPNHREALIIPGQPNDPRLFEYLEPAPTPFKAKLPASSRLEQLTTEPNARLGVILLGAIAIMYGLLPAAKSASSRTTLVS